MTLNCSGLTELTILTHEQGETTVLTLRGELDISSAPAFAEAIAQTAAHGAGELLLDISHLEFVDSTGLRAILAAKALCEEQSCRFAVTPPSPGVRRLFEVTGVARHLGQRDFAPDGSAEPIQLWPPPLQAPAARYADSETGRHGP
jgi:anti-sigma B factor antagonist